MELVTHSSPTIALPHAPTPVLACEEVERHFVHRGHGAEFEMEARWIARRIPDSDRRVLDIGCGIGALFSSIGAARVVGLDFVHAGLLQTRRRFPESRLACGDGMTLPFADGAFDAITAQHVIEHLSDADAACDEWKRVLRIGGRLLIVTPNARYCDPGVYSDPTHVQIFDEVSLRTTVSRAGLIVEAIYSIGLPWFREYHRFPSGWRARRLVLNFAEMLARIPGLCRAGQSLCCLARSKAVA
jgi:SAM-dependent methyltransferase